MSKKLKGNLLLFLTAIIWGSSFVAQKAGMEYIGPFTFNGIRLIIAGISLLPVIYFFSIKKNKKSNIKFTKKDKSIHIIGGISCGIALFIAASLQQIGVVYTTAGKAGFITALYVVMVPIFGVIFLKKKVTPLMWISVVIATIGLYLLSFKIGDTDFKINKGDILVILCAVFYTVHILVIDYFSPKTDGIILSCIQFFVAGFISLIIMFITEHPELSAILICTIPILYSGVLSAGIGYTLQIVAQKDTDPTVASLILCLESVFAVIAGMIILKETLTNRELIGCLIMFVAIILSQIPVKTKEKV